MEETETTTRRARLENRNYRSTEWIWLVDTEKVDF